MGAAGADLIVVGHGRALGRWIRHGSAVRARETAVCMHVYAV
jgi:hypothetical protein